MKTFKDLKFKQHPAGNGLQARLDFPNKYGVSVVRFKKVYNPLDNFIVEMCAENNQYGSYTSNEQEWELAVFYNGDICYNTNITSDVLGHLSDKDVTKVMAKVQKLKKNSKK